MALIPCPECGNQVSNKANNCPKCGFIINPTPPILNSQIGANNNRKLSRGCVISFFAIFGILSIFAFCIRKLERESTSSDNIRSNHTVQYSITGTTRRASITFTNETNGTQQIDPIEVPWVKNFYAQDGTHLYLSAQNNKDWGSVKCKISVDGVDVKVSESDGAYVIATCSAFIGSN